MSTSKASGPFSIPSKIIKEFVGFFVPILTTIINKSFKESVFPSNLKCAKVILIFKKGNKTKCPNYRPIFPLSNVSKIFERIMYNRLETHLNSNSILYKHQYGFRKNNSTALAIYDLVENLMKAKDKGEISCAVFLDLSKAFDTVDRNILLKKLEHYSIRGPPLQLLESYLTNRKQYTIVNGGKSCSLSIDIGVPQGSVLGPLLFLIYINDLPLVSNLVTKLFADDTCLIFSSKSLNSLQIRLMMS